MKIGSDLVVTRNRGPLDALVPNLGLAWAIVLFCAGMLLGAAVTLARLA